jgi:hypothetical protein
VSDATKKKKAPPRRKRRMMWVIMASVLLIVWAMSGIYVDFAPLRPIDELEQVRATWESFGPDAYSYYSMHVAGIERGISLGSMTIDVEDEHPIKIYDGSLCCGGKPLKAPPAWIQTFKDQFPSNSSQWTITGLFEFAAQKLKDRPAPKPLSLCGWSNMDTPYSRYNVDYNSYTGYITTINYTCESEWNVGLGLLCGSTQKDCSSGISISVSLPLQR